MLESFKTNFIVWNHADEDITGTIYINESDENGRRLRLQVTNNGSEQNTSGVSAYIYWEAKSKKELTAYFKYEQEGLEAFKVIDYSKGLYEYTYSSAMKKNIGMLVGNIVLVDNQGRTISKPFPILNQKGINDEVITSGDNFSALTDALTRVEGLFASFDINAINTKIDQKIAESANELSQNISKFKSGINTDITLFKKDVNDRMGAIENQESPEVLTPYKKAINMQPTPTFGDGTYAWNGCPYIQDNLTIYNGYQYGVYVESGRNLIVFKRQLPDGKMQHFDIGAVSNLATALGLPAVKNSHCTFSLGIDKDGYIHIAGNMHAVQLRYIRSNQPENITSWSARSMTGSGEDRVTYPAFVKMRDGDLLFFYRNGISSISDIRLNRYNTATKTWSQVSNNLIDGNVSSEGPYINHIAVDKNNVIHLMFVWRKLSGTGINNADVGYAKSADKGVTWQKTDGSTYRKPITHANQETAMPSVGRGLLNQSGLEVDQDGNPHGAFLMNDSAGNTQIYHVWRNGTRWFNTQVTNFSTKYNLAGGVIDYTNARPSVFTTKNNRVYIIYRKNNEGLRGSLRVIDVTPGNARNDFEILQLDLQNVEVTFDTQSLYERNELHMLVGRMVSDGPDSIVWNHEDNWNKQSLWILSIDLDSIAEIQREAVPLYHVKQIATFPAILSGDIIVDTTTPRPIDLSGLMIDFNLTGKQVFVRMRMRSNLVKTTPATKMTMIMTQSNEWAEKQNTLTRYGTLIETSVLTTHRATPWLPLQAEISEEGSFLAAYGSVDAGQGRMTLLQMEIGILDK